MEIINVTPDFPENYIQHGKEVYAFVSDINERVKGIVAADINGSRCPLVSLDFSQLEMYLPIAAEIAKKTGKTIKLVKYTLSEVIQELEP